MHNTLLTVDMPIGYFSLSGITRGFLIPVTSATDLPLQSVFFFVETLGKACIEHTSESLFHAPAKNA